MAIKTETVTGQVEVALCDFCGGRVAGFRTCMGCGLHVCLNCSNPLQTDPFSGQDYGDYCPSICLRCKGILTRFEPVMNALLEDMEHIQAEAREAWEKACKKGIGE